MDTEIPNAALTAADVPASASETNAVMAFARSFDGYAYWGERCGDRTDRFAAAFAATGALPEKLSDLRACLFYEQGRIQWSGNAPDERELAWVQALLDAIRSALAA